jgi:uncharacterized protein YfaS (alpha-2-macroglobulin family)
LKNVSRGLCLILFCAFFISSLQAQTPAITLKTDFPTQLRQGDRTELHLTIQNGGNTETTGQAQLLLMDAATETPADGWFQNFFPNQYFTVAAKDSTNIAFPVEVPYTFFGPASVRAVWRTATDSGSVHTTLNILPQEKLHQQNMLLHRSGNYEFAPLLHLQNEDVRHASLKLQLAAAPAAFAYAALPAIASRPALPLVGSAQQLFALSIALQLWRTQPGAASELFTGNAQFTDSSKLKAQIMQSIAAFTAAQAPDGSWAPWPGSSADASTTAQIVLCIGRLHRLKALDAGDHQKLLAMAKKGLRLLQKKAPGIATAYLENLLQITPKTPIPHALNRPENFIDAKSFLLEKACIEANKAACDSIAAALLLNWEKGQHSMAAIYALLMAYPAPLQPPPSAAVQWGNMAAQGLPSKSLLPETTLPAARIQPSAGKLRLQVTGSMPVWAVVSWQWAQPTDLAAQKEVQQAWHLLQKDKALALTAGSTIRLGDTVETTVRINNKAPGTDWVAAGIPAGLRPVSILFDDTQMWAEHFDGTVYAWMPAAGQSQFTVRMVAAHRGLFYSGATYSGTNDGDSKISVASEAITVE